MINKTKFALDGRTKTFLICGAIAGPFFVLVVLIEGITRINYNSFRYPLSSLSIGDLGWIQIANFIITGLLLFLFSIGLKQTFNSPNEKFRAPLMMMIVGIGLIGAGIFSTDPIYGYPVDKPLMLAQFSIHGHLHDAFSILVFIFLPLSCFLFRKRFVAKGERGWANYSFFTGISMIAVFVLSSIGFKQLLGLTDYAGLFQRLCITFGWTWIALLSLHLLRAKAIKFI